MTLPRLTDNVRDQWPDGTLIVVVPEPGEVGWSGRWECWLARVNGAEFLVRSFDQDRERAVDFADRLSRHLFPLGTKIVERPCPA